MMRRCPHCGLRSLYADEDGRGRCLLCTRPLEPLPPPEEQTREPVFAIEAHYRKRPRALISGVGALRLAKGKADYSRWPQRPRKGKGEA